MTIINSIVWEHVAGDLYDCTDAGLPGYFEPGNWVHNFDGRTITVVAHIVHGRSMSEPDTIKEGWTGRRLLSLWYLFFGASVIISFVLARARWIPKRQASYEHVPAA
jgi:hypothetical protein